MGGGNGRRSGGQRAGQGAEETRDRAALRQLGPSICASPLNTSFLGALSAPPSLACFPRLRALRPDLSQLHIPSHRHTWGPSRLEAGCWAPGPAPCKPCPTSQVASSPANPLAQPLPAPSPAPSSSGEAARPSRPLALPLPLPPGPAAPLRGHHAPAQAWRLTLNRHHLSAPPPPAGPQGKEQGPQVPVPRTWVPSPLPTLMPTSQQRCSERGQSDFSPRTSEFQPPLLQTPKIGSRAPPPSNPGVQAPVPPLPHKKQSWPPNLSFLRTQELRPPALRPQTREFRPLSPLSTPAQAQGPPAL